MRYYGKVVGAIVGWFALRHPLGALLGAVLGHAFDAGWLAWRRPPSPPPAPPPPAIVSPYATLGVSETATEAEIDRAYRQLMGKYHPDRVAGAASEIRALAEERARAINGAYDRIKAMRRPRR